MLASFPSWVLDTVQERQERHEYPMWVTDRWDAENWRECLLLQLGCDRTAIERFFVLNQCTNNGPYVANNVLVGLLMEEQDAFNPSAFLTATCNNMTPLLEQSETLVLYRRLF